MFPYSSVHAGTWRAPWLGSYSVVQTKHLKGQPLYGSAVNAGCGEREAMVTLHPVHVTPQHRLASMAARLSSTGISHHSLLPHIPSVCLSTVNSSLLSGIAPQSLNPSSQPLHLPGDLHPCPGYAWLWQGLSDSHSI